MKIKIKLFWPKRNFKRLSNTVFKAYNQNGFNNALYKYFEEEIKYETNSKKDVRQMVTSFPKKYPCTFAVIDNTFECSKIHIDVFY